MRQYYIAVPVSLIENMCKALSEYELTDGDWKACFDKIHDACVDIDAFCRDKLNVEALEQEPCGDAISRQAAIDAIFAEPLYKLGMKKRYAEEAVPAIFEKIKALPPVTPQYTEAEIQKMQDLEFAEIQKAYEIGKAEGSEVLDKIRAEIDSYCSDNRDRNDGLYIAMRIIDKYKAESEDKE